MFVLEVKFVLPCWLLLWFDFVVVCFYWFVCCFVICVDFGVDFDVICVVVF